MGGMTIVQIVRRYGPVGGMERYVWELSRELASMGHSIHVLCEEAYSDDIPLGLRIHCLGRTWPKPRWLAHMKFSRRASNWIRNNCKDDWIIHSHERCAHHDLTTFHGPPFAHVRESPLWKRLSLRVAANLWLERREIFYDSVWAVVPCSLLTREQLSRFYPAIADRLTEPILPGVASGPSRPARNIPRQGGTIGFVGYEWRRKGLDIAIQVVSQLRKSRPDLEFLVAGPDPAAIKHLFVSYDGKCRLLGNFKTAELYPQLDLLLHPARQEPFGMVIAEAMAARVRVVVSSDCGVQSEVTPQRGAVLSLRQPLEEWSEACDQMLNCQEPPAGYQRSWKQVATEHERLYQSIAFQKTGMSA